MLSEYDQFVIDVTLSCNLPSLLYGFAFSLVAWVDTLSGVKDSSNDAFCLK